MTAPALELRGLSKSFGGVQAVRAVSLAVQGGLIYAIIGPNGAGKSTVINLLTGALKPSAGRIFLQGKDITGLAPHRVTARGMARIFQSGKLFRRLTALENVMVGGHHRIGAGLGATLLRRPGFRRGEAGLAEKARATLDRLGLGAHADADVTSLPYGRQRMIEIARALMAGPSVLLLDEPAAGLNSGEVERFIGFLGELRAGGLTVVLIEHNMGLVMRVADRIAVLNFGEKIAEGTPAEVRADPAVLEAYLGRGYVHAAD